MNMGRPTPLHDPRAMRIVLIIISVLYLVLLVLAPLAVVAGNALDQGFARFIELLNEPDTRAAIRLTLVISAVVVPINLLFGLSAAWLLSRFKFKARSLILTCIDAPLAVSPVIAGLIFVLLFGVRGLFGPLLTQLGISIIFAVPGMILATLFITLPFVAREVLPLMEEQGAEEEEAALTLGASAARTFFSVTIPNIIWALVYGIVLSNARAMGEFGAVSVISGHIRGETHTMPLEIEVLYNEYHFSGAFALSFLLVLMAVVTIAIKSIVEWHFARKGIEN